MSGGGKITGNLSTDAAFSGDDELIEVEKLRIEHGITLRDLCYVAEIGEKTYRNMRAGRHVAYARTRAAVKRALKAIIRERNG